MRARSIMITSNKETRRSRFFYRNGAGAVASSKSTIVFVWASKTCDQLLKIGHSLYFGAGAPVVK
jgi:hypothetical protein